MDKEDSITLLKQCLDRIPQLRTLPFNNMKYKLWCYKVDTILKKAFDNDDYEKFNHVQEKYFLEEAGLDYLLLEENYPNMLSDYESVLSSIIWKYKKMRIVGEGDKGRKMEEQTPEKTKEIEIYGDSLEQLYPIIKMVASELRFKEHFYETRLATSNLTDNYAGFAVFTIDPLSMSKTLVGAFTLLLLGDNRIMLRVSPRSRWHHDFDLTPLETAKLGLISKSVEDKQFNNELFNQFINSLHYKLTHYGLKIAIRNRLWQWINTHKIISIIITFITLVAAIITIYQFIFSK